MLKKDAVEFFGSRAKIQKILGLSNAAVYQWGEIIPKGSAGKLYVLSGHKIPYRVEDYAKNEEAQP